MAAAGVGVDVAAEAERRASSWARTVSVSMPDSSFLMKAKSHSIKIWGSFPRRVSRRLDVSSSGETCSVIRDMTYSAFELMLPSYPSRCLHMIIFALSDMIKACLSVCICVGVGVLKKKKKRIIMGIILCFYKF